MTTPTLYESEETLRLAHERLSDLLDAQENAPSAEANAALQVAERSLVTEIEAAMLAAAEKRDGCAFVLRRMESDIAMLRNEAKRVQGIADRATAHAERFLGYVLTVMQEHHLDVLEGRYSRFKIVQNPAHVEVGMPDALPEQYVRVIPEKREPDKVKIGAALKAGDDVPGCRMAPGGTRLKLSDKRV
jgi:hypothetical protein